jgi:hypothetical protein
MILDVHTGHFTYSMPPFYYLSSLPPGAPPALGPIIYSPDNTNKHEALLKR